MAEGEEQAEVLAELARGHLKSKQTELKQALVGRVLSHHRFMLTRLLEQLDFYDSKIKLFNQEIEQRLGLVKPEPPNLNPTPTPTPTKVLRATSVTPLVCE